MSGLEMAFVWLGLAFVVTLLGMHAGYRMGRAKNEWERRHWQKIEDENRSLRRELSVARVKVDGATKLFEVAGEPANGAEIGPVAAGDGEDAGEPVAPAGPAPAPVVVDLRKIALSEDEAIVIDLTDGAERLHGEDVAALEALLEREVELMAESVDA